MKAVVRLLSAIYLNEALLDVPLFPRSVRRGGRPVIRFGLLLVGIIMLLFVVPAWAVDVRVTGDPEIVSGADCSDTNLPTYRFPTNAVVNGVQVDILLQVLAEDNDWTTSDWTGACVRSQKDNSDNYTGRIELFLRDRDPDDDVAYMDLKLQLVERGTNNVVTPSRLQAVFLDLDSWDRGDHSNDHNYTDSDDVYLKTQGYTAAPYLSDQSRVTLVQNPGNGYDVKFKGWYDNNGHECNDADVKCYASMVYLDTGTIYLRLQNDNAYGDPQAYTNAVRRMVLSLLIDDLEKTLNYNDSGDAPTAYGQAMLGATTSLSLGDGLLPDENSSYAGNAQADGDDQATDLLHFDDEDGVTYEGHDLQGSVLGPGNHTLRVHTYNESGETGYLNIWVDWNRDGDFGDSGEHLVSNQPISQSGRATTLINFVVPDDIERGASYIRVVYSQNQITQPDASGGGEGEVEDYRVQLAPRFIEGHVFEDISGDALHDGDTDFTDANGDQVARAGVAVYLYQDGGDGLPDGNDDTPVGSTTTDSQGHYAFSVNANHTYWVVVDSKTVSPSAGFNSGAGQGDVWAEQTYGPKGGLCDTDGDPTTPPSELSRATACYGGRYGNRSDDATELSTAEHVAKVSVGTSDVTGVDFGFSFNVVTNTNDQDDDGSTNRTAQGSLRQFIQNANAIQGPNTMLFVPAVPKAPGKDYWRIEPSRAMNASDPFSSGTGPVFRITDSGTTIKGIAYMYDYHDDELVELGGAVARPGRTVGYREICDIENFVRPHLEVFVSRRHQNDQGQFSDEPDLWDIGNHGEDASIFYVESTASNFILERVSAYGGHYAVFVDGAGDSTITDNFLGIGASGLADPDTSGQCPGPNCPRSNRGIVLHNVSSAKVSHNLIGYTRLHGIFLSEVSGNYTSDDVEHGSVVIEQNEVAYPSRGWWHENGIGLEQGSENVVVRCNYVHHSGAVGIETWGSDGGHWIGQNTVQENGLGDTEFQSGHGDSYNDKRERIGIRLKAANNTVKYNEISQNQGVGVLVVGGFNQNRISKNSFFQNGATDDSSRQWLAIDLLDGDTETQITRNLGDGVLANDGVFDNDDGNQGIDYPVLTKAELDDTTLRLEGYIGSNRASQWLSGAFTIEVYKADDDGNNDGEIEAGDGLNVAHGEGKVYLGSCSVTLGSSGTFSCTISDVGALNADDTVTATATDGNGNTSEFSANASVTLAGVPISGRVYHDLGPNGTLDAGENWSSGTTVYVKLVDGSGSVVQVKQVDPGTGDYQFDAVPVGSYTLVLDNNDNTSDTTPNPPAGWLFISPPDGRRSVTVGTAAVTGQDFGLFHGARVSGTVFRDTGDGAATANDGVQQGDEPGVPNVAVSVSDGSHTRTANTDASGAYVLYVPADWGSVTLAHPVRPASGRNDGSSVHKATSWADATAPNSSAASVSLGAASDIAGQQITRNFGVVFQSAFRPDESGTVTSPGSRVYRHTYAPGTQGTVTFARSGGDYSYQLRFDPNCDGDFDDDGEGWRPVSASERPSFTVGDAWPRNPDGSFKACAVEVRVLVPDGEPEGAVDLAGLTASLKWANNAGVTDARRLVDATTVRVGGTLRLEKRGRRVADPLTDQTPGTFPDDYAVAVSGRPGDVLEYCIRYRNLGTEPVTQVVVKDPVPFFADALSDGFGSGKAIYWQDAGGNVHYLSAAADTDAGEIQSGQLKVRAEVSLEAGKGGLVCYRVRIR